ncbi:hypothetical protein GCM10023169_38940 [Georgenia halophila]|uniref:Uncharacterized protein n=1 Tax=Georgenia halophila TaxID=620889 RepID=A0ABP8LMX1_9MICO
MKLGRRTSRLPSEIRSELPGGEPPLAAAELVDGEWAVATAGALVVAGPDGVTARHPWHTIEQGRWDGDTRTVTVTWVEGSVEPLQLRTATDDVATFTSALRERVQSSVVHSEVTETPGGAHIHVYIRRDEHGALLSQVTATGPLRGDEAENRQINELERRARSTVGLDT